MVRIVPDLISDQPLLVADFYAEVFGLEPAMDQGWVRSLVSPANRQAELIVMAADNVQAPVPVISIGVDDVDLAHRRACSCGATIVYDIRDEPWGVRRFFVADPDGPVVNVVGHK